VGAWTEAGLADIGGANELLNVYVRSVNGPGGAWFRGVRARHAEHISDRITSSAARSTTVRFVRS
jgi:hypothetical protein